MSLLHNPRRAFAVVGAIAALLFAGTSPVRAETPSSDCGPRTCRTVDVTAGREGFEAVASRSDRVPGRGAGTPGGVGSGLSVWSVVGERVAPTCSGRSQADGDVICAVAVSTCPPPLLRFWVWHQVVRFARQGDGSVVESAGPWVQEPGSYCLGPDDPGVPDYARAVGLVQVGFRDLPLPRARVQVAPSPRTLVRFPTAFYAGGEQSFQVTVTPVPGVSVLVTARPVSWTWQWGDGSVGTFGAAGEPGRPVVAHSYERTGSVGVRVVVTWRGSFTLAGSAQPVEIAVPAVVSSETVPLQVMQARSQLVAQ